MSMIDLTGGHLALIPAPVAHKKIGLMCIAHALILPVVTGLEAVLMRLQLTIPNDHLVRGSSSIGSSPGNTVATAHELMRIT